MSSELMPAGNGWVKPPGSRKYHYFEKTRSLCGRYAFMREEGEKDTGNYNDGDCVTCVRELKKRTEGK